MKHLILIFIFLISFTASANKDVLKVETKKEVIEKKAKDLIDYLLL